MGTLLSRHGDSPVYHTQFDPTVAGASIRAIVEALSAVTDTPPLELPPLYDAIDTDALERFLDHAARRGNGSTVAMEFAIDDWDVVVTGAGSVSVYER